MRALAASDLLEVWERGLSQNGVERALTLLGAACEGESREALELLSVGERDARLLRLREWTFGPRLASVVDCPSCGEQVELEFSTSDLRAGNKAAASREAVLRLTAGGYEVSFRLPNSLDLAEVAAGAPAALGGAEARFLDRCVLEATRGGERLATTELPAEIAEAVAGRMAAADPQADVELALECPGCGRSWPAPFDIEPFFWDEINSWARRMLGEVHLLASAYGWREADILRMSASRRQLYLDLVGR